MKIFETITNVVLMILLLSAAVSRDGKLFGYTEKDLQKEQKKTVEKIVVNAPKKADLEEASFKNVNLEKISDGIWKIEDDKGDKVGSVIASKQFCSKIYGYAGDIPMYIFISKENVIKYIKILKNSETRGFLRNAIRKGVVKQWIGKNISDIPTFQADVVTGATYSSTAINKSVALSISKFSGKVSEISSNRFFNLKNIAALIILALGIFVSFFKRKNKNIRIVQLSLNVIVLGFWCGQFISMNAMLNLVQNGISGSSNMILLILIAIALILPLFKGHAKYYCTWVCPYGSAQELVGKITKKKFQPSKKAMKYLKYSKRVITLGLLFAMWVGASTDIVGYEPFSAFLFENASWIILTIAILGLVASIFTPKFWCRFVCPTGQILDWSQKLN